MKLSRRCSWPKGWNPVMCDREVKDYLAEAVVAWLFDPRGRGAESGLSR